MSTLNHLFDLPEQICYVECGFCTTTLMVSVPCSSFSMVVTVRCGHCTSLLSVNMKKTSFVPLHLLASLTHLEPNKGSSEDGANKTLKSYNAYRMNYSDCEEENMPQLSNAVNKPPEKRQRTPSPYNRFIKEEIKRLKAENPKMAHKEAFSTAAKNWANFPPSRCKGEADSCKLVDLDCHAESFNAPKCGMVVSIYLLCNREIVQLLNKNSLIISVEETYPHHPDLSTSRGTVYLLQKHSR